MRLMTSTSFEDTAEHFWRLRKIAGQMLGPLPALLARRRTLAAYERLSPRILEDIGLPSGTVLRAKADNTSLSEAARRERGDAAWRAGERDPFGARVPFGRPRTAATAPAKVVSDRPQGADRIDARVPFARSKRVAPGEGQIAA